ncbi:type III-A CRISPR-associated protein Csm2 [Methanocalculus sp. MC3]
MSRDLYNNQNQRQSGSRNYGSSTRDDYSQPAFMEGIKNVVNLSDLKVDDIAKENGIAELAAREFKKAQKELKTTQLRKFFSQAKSIEANLKEKGWDAVSAEFAMLRPILAYAKGRKAIPDSFYTFMTLCMGKVVAQDGNEELTRKNYTRFMQILESVVAYQKYYEDKRE